MQDATSIPSSSQTEADLQMTELVMPLSMADPDDDFPTAPLLLESTIPLVLAPTQKSRLKRKIPAQYDIRDNVALAEDETKEVNIDPKDETQVHAEVERIKSYYVMNCQEIGLSITRLQDPISDFVHRPVLHSYVLELETLMKKSVETPTAATVIPYKVRADGAGGFKRIKPSVNTWTSASSTWLDMAGNNTKRVDGLSGRRGLKTLHSMNTDLDGGGGDWSSAVRLKGDIKVQLSHHYDPKKDYDLHSIRSRTKDEETDEEKVVKDDHPLKKYMESWKDVGTAPKESSESYQPASLDDAGVDISTQPIHLSMDFLEPQSADDFEEMMDPEHAFLLKCGVVTTGVASSGGHIPTVSQQTNPSNGEAQTDVAQLEAPRSTASTRVYGRPLAASSSSSSGGRIASVDAAQPVAVEV
ncbi:hypothetical protein R1sor_020464 [Riccia sorocarpa]|uniref:Uncharacterized protein n=1 Tax=Riccia sorocarpa TaxID=122646 RepID=A0ABD3II95_9MARC